MIAMPQERGRTRSNDKSRPSEYSYEQDQTSDSFDSWFNRPYVSDERKKNLQGSNVLILPIENFPGTSGPVFPVQTAEILHFLKQQAPKGLIPEICIDDRDYKELALYHDHVNVGLYLVTLGAAPLVINLLAEYIKRKIWASRVVEPHIEIDFRVTESRQHTVRFRYSGPASKFDETIGSAVAARYHRNKLLDATHGAGEDCDEPSRD